MEKINNFEKIRDRFGKIEDNLGKIRSVKDYIVEVEFLGQHKPQIHNILTLVDHSEVKLMGLRWSSPSIFLCIALTDHGSLYRGARVCDTLKPLMVPVGPSVLARVLDIFGSDKDGLGEISRVVERPIYNQSAKVWEIKA